MTRKEAQDLATMLYRSKEDIVHGAYRPAEKELILQCVEVVAEEVYIHGARRLLTRAYWVTEVARVWRNAWYHGTPLFPSRGEQGAPDGRQATPQG